MALWYRYVTISALLKGGLGGLLNSNLVIHTSTIMNRLDAKFYCRLWGSPYGCVVDGHVFWCAWKHSI